MDVTKFMQDFSFGFKYKGKPFNIFESSEYISVKLVHEHHQTEELVNSTDIGLQECSTESNLLDIFSADYTTKKWGTFYCSKKVNPD